MPSSTITTFRLNGESRELAIIVALSLAALATRAYGFWQWEFVQDEYFTITAASERFPSLKNPAIYGLVLGSVRLFGISEWSVRLYTVILGAISIPVFFATWKNVLGRNAALIGAILVLFSSWHLFHSQYARYYSGVLLFGSLSFYLYYRAVRLDSPLRLVASVVAALAALLFHVTSVMVLAACGFFSILIALRRVDSQFSRRIAAVHLLIVLIGGLAALPFLWQIAMDWYGHERGWTHGNPAVMLLKIVRNAQIPIAVAALGGLILMLRRNRPDAVFLGVGAGIPLLFVTAANALVPIRSDYYFYSMPLVFLLAGYLCEQARVAMSEYGLASHAVTALVLAGLVPAMVFYYTDRMTLDVREPVAFVKQHYRPGDRIVTFGTGFQYYLGDKYSTEHVGNAYYGGPWRKRLDPYKDADGRTWVLLRARRAPLAKGLEDWLLQNAVLVWRKFSVRYDDEVRGYEIFLVNDTPQHGAASAMEDAPALREATPAPPSTQ